MPNIFNHKYSLKAVKVGQRQNGGKQTTGKWVDGVKSDYIAIIHNVNKLDLILFGHSRSGCTTALKIAGWGTRCSSCSNIGLLS